MTALAQGQPVALSERDIADLLNKTITHELLDLDLMTCWHVMHHPNLPSFWVEQFARGNPAGLSDAELTFARVRMASNPAVDEPMLRVLFATVDAHFHSDWAFSSSSNPNCPVDWLKQWGTITHPDRMHAFAMLNVLDHPRTPPEVGEQCMNTLVRYSEGHIPDASTEYGDGRRQVGTRIAAIAIDPSDPRSAWVSESDRSRLLIAVALN